MIKQIVHLILTLAVLALGIAGGMHLLNSAPEAERRSPQKNIPLVEVITATPRTYNVYLDSRGTVSPRTESTLIPQVAGRVISLSDNFRDGGFFEQGEELLTIDPTDYQLALTIAQSELAKMRLALNEERAQARQAESDWKKLGMKGKPDALVLRKPQLANAHAALASAEARVRQAEVELERTRLLAPYAGRIMEQLVDIGQVVSPGTTLAKIYATDYVEVRLPLTDRQLAFIDLPESYRGESVQSAPPEVELIADQAGQRYHWQGRIVRTEGTFDTRSRQLFVIAQVANPYAREAGSQRPPLKIGQFVRARIKGHQLSNVFILPRNVISGADHVLLVDETRHIQRRQIDIIWQDDDQVIIGAGLNPGDTIISTLLPYAIEGAEVRLASDAKDPATDQHALQEH